MRDKLLRYFLSWLYWFPIIRHNIACRKSLLKPLYKKRCEDGLSCNEGDRKIIYMVLPETTFSGGLSDRLRAIVAIYKQCNTKNLPFRIVFEPLHLQDYLVPNKYDWRISSKDICFDTNKVYPCTLLTYHASTRNRYQQFVQNTILSYYLKQPYQQIHVYSNMICKDEEYGALFNELFKPSAELQELIDYHLNKIGGSNTYVSLTFRFRQLLGDFKEGGETLPEAQREPYIARCLKCIEEHHDRYPGKKILVTSDSSTFLTRVSEDERISEYTYLIPGKVVHIGFTSDASKQTYMKSFVDYFMLANAEEIFLVRDKKMYHSGFPYRAALLKRKKYSEISL